MLKISPKRCKLAILQKPELIRQAIISFLVLMSMSENYMHCGFHISVLNRTSHDFVSSQYRNWEKDGDLNLDSTLSKRYRTV